MKISFVILGTITLLTTIGATNAYAQMPPPLESTPSNESNTEENISFGKITIPISSGEQIILDVPAKDGNSYKLVPIK